MFGSMELSRPKLSPSFHRATFYFDLRFWWSAWNGRLGLPRKEISNQKISDLRLAFVTFPVPRLIRTDSDNKDFRSLVSQLDEWLAFIDGADNAFYSALNKIDKIKNAVVAYEDEKPVGCGAVRELTADVMEVKRMFTLPDYRKRGIAKEILAELEKWSKELGYRKCVLETGKRQPEAIDLYLKRGYSRIANYGQYVGVDNSVCFEKEL